MAGREGLQHLIQQCLDKADGDTARAGDLLSQSLPAIIAPDLPLPPRPAAALAGLSVVAFWRAVRERRLPQPVYPASRSPRWYASEIRAALEQLRLSPREAVAQRRKASLAKERARQAKIPAEHAT